MSKLCRYVHIVVRASKFLLESLVGVVILNNFLEDNSEVCLESIRCAFFLDCVLVCKHVSEPQLYPESDISLW